MGATVFEVAGVGGFAVPPPPWYKVWVPNGFVKEGLITLSHIKFTFETHFLQTDAMTMVSQPSKCLKFMTFREGCFSYAIECKYLSEALKTFYQH